jgi:hypothetical protein
MRRKSSDLIALSSLVAVLLFLGTSRLSAQAEPDAVAIVGARFAQLGDTVFISYRLVAPDDEEVSVSVTLRKGEDTTFAIIPVSATGAIGQVRGGGDKLILWNYRNDVPPGFQFGTDYWFQFEAMLGDHGFSPQWWHYAIGGGVLTGVALIVSTSEDGTAPGAPYALPGPPGTRPPDE